MYSIVADTHAIIWYLSASSKLSSRAKTAFLKAFDSGGKVHISSISIAEIIYLVEKKRIPKAALNRLVNSLKDENSFFVIVPFTLEIALEISSIPRDIVGDLPDRIIATTASFLNLPLVTRDRGIQAASTIKTIW